MNTKDRPTIEKPKSFRSFDSNRSRARHFVHQKLVTRADGSVQRTLRKAVLRVLRVAIATHTIKARPTVSLLVLSINLTTAVSRHITYSFDTHIPISHTIMHPNTSSTSASTSTQVYYAAPATPKKSNGVYAYLEDILSPMKFIKNIPPSPSKIWTSWTGDVSIVEIYMWHADDGHVNRKQSIVFVLMNCNAIHPFNLVPRTRSKRHILRPRFY